MIQLDKQCLPLLQSLHNNLVVRGKTKVLPCLPGVGGTSIFVPFALGLGGPLLLLVVDCRHHGHSCSFLSNISLTNITSKQKLNENGAVENGGTGNLYNYIDLNKINTYLE
jgi:hypothetical protein